MDHKDLLCSTGSSVQCYMAARVGGEFGREWIHAYMWLSLFAVHLKLSQHCLLIGYTLIQNKTFSKTIFKIKTKTKKTLLCIWAKEPH